MTQVRVLTLAACVGIAILPGCESLKRWHYTETQALRTHAAWHAFEDCQDCVYNADFRDGWLVGYYDVLTGGSGIPPIVPPERYWNPCEIVENGDAGRCEWYRGFQTGAACACNQADAHYLKVWLTPACGPICGPACEPMAPPNLLGPAASPGVEPLPAPEELPMDEFDAEPADESLHPSQSIPQAEPSTIPVPDEPPPPPNSLETPSTETPDRAIPENIPPAAAPSVTPPKTLPAPPAETKAGPQGQAPAARVKFEADDSPSTPDDLFGQASQQFMWKSDAPAKLSFDDDAEQPGRETLEDSFALPTAVQVPNQRIAPASATPIVAPAGKSARARSASPDSKVFSTPTAPQGSDRSATLKSESSAPRTSKSVPTIES